MTDMERLYTAKLYIDKLANGMNPFDGEELPNDTILNDINLCRSFVYISGVLDKVIRNNGQVTSRSTERKERFRISEPQKRAIVITEEPVGINAISSRIMRVLDNGVKGIPSITITSWLEAEGLLERIVQNGKAHREATPDGNMLGIYTKLITSGDREYPKTLYDINAQAFIVSNIESIAEFGERQ